MLNLFQHLFHLLIMTNKKLGEHSKLHYTNYQKN